MAGLLVNVLLQFDKTVRQLLGLFVECVAVQQNSMPLHGEQDFHDRHFNRGVDILEFVVMIDSGIKFSVQLQGNVRVFGSVVFGALQLDLRKRNARRTLAGNLVITNGFDVEVTRRRSTVASRAEQTVRIFVGEF